MKKSAMYHPVINLSVYHSLEKVNDSLSQSFCNEHNAEQD